jgi:hypothetical protein
MYCCDSLQVVSVRGFDSQVRGILLLGLLAVVSLPSCSSDPTYLPALLADPVADYEAPGLQLIDSWERAEGRDFFMDKPVHAEVGRTYRIADQDQAERILNDAVEFAQGHEWRLEPSIISPNTLYIGAKDLGPGEGRLSIALGAADPLHDPDGQRVLQVLLDFGPVRFDDTTTTAPGGN